MYEICPCYARAEGIRHHLKSSGNPKIITENINFTKSGQVLKDIINVHFFAVTSILLFWRGASQLILNLLKKLTLKSLSFREGACMGHVSTFLSCNIHAGYIDHHANYIRKGPPTGNIRIT